MICEDESRTGEFSFAPANQRSLSVATVIEALFRD
jgi:hypothetical protein